jgi:hypothetical protein
LAYPECPDCRVPQLVPDEADTYTCFTCFADLRFYRCPECDYPQTIAKRWPSFTCGRCERKVDPPRSVSLSTSPRARHTAGVGYTYPKL